MVRLNIPNKVIIMPGAFEMKRKIIKINEEKCDGCGLCIPDCPEGALQVIDGKARLVSDLFCDGLGACIGTCPRNAIAVEERESEPYDESAVMENIVAQGAPVVLAHLNHLKEHRETDLLGQAVRFLEERYPELIDVTGFKVPETCLDSGIGSGGCPGAALRDMREKRIEKEAHEETVSRPHLRNWPVQLQLLNPQAPFLKGADLLISSDCVPYAIADFHRRFLSDKILITFCPKLDRANEEYIEKLSIIFKDSQVKSVSVLHMEVPCCSGSLRIVEQALQKAGKVIPVKDYTISITGEII
jgi:ferredoxin